MNDGRYRRSPVLISHLYSETKEINQAVDLIYGEMALWIAKRNQKVYELHTEGESDNDIAKRFGWNPSTVKKMRRKHKRGKS